MSLEDFATKLRQLEDPFTDIKSRHAADQWLIQFRNSPQAWTAAQAGLSSIFQLRTPCAQMLAYKTKKQLDQLPSPDQRGALLESIVGILASNALGGDLAAVRALCIAISNLIIHSPDLQRPLESLAARLSDGLMLELLTVLPGECEDYYESNQHISSNGASEFNLQLKQRAQEWCQEVGAWLSSSQTSILQSDPALHALPRQPTSIEEALQHAGHAAITASCALIRCFAAWIRWGGLFHMAVQHWEQLLRVSGGLMLLDPGTAPYEEGLHCGVETIIEAIERPCDGAQSILLDICLRLPQQAVILAQKGANFGQLEHVFASYCSTNTQLVASGTPQGAALRNALLHFVSMEGSSSTREFDNEDEGDNGVPAVDALGDVMETVLDSNGDDEDRRASTTESSVFNNKINAERIQFAGSAVVLFMQITQCPPEALLLGSSSGAVHALPAGLRALRAQSAWPLWLCGEILTADGITKRIYESFQSVVAQNGLPSPEALRALDVRKLHLSILNLILNFSDGILLIKPILLPI